MNVSGHGPPYMKTHSAPESIAARPWHKPADTVQDFRSRSLPVDAAVLFFEDRGKRRLRRILFFGRDFVDARERFDEEIGAHDCEPQAELDGSFVGGDRGL